MKIGKQSQNIEDVRGEGAVRKAGVFAESFGLSFMTELERLILGPSVTSMGAPHVESMEEMKSLLQSIRKPGK